VIDRSTPVNFSRNLHLCVSALSSPTLSVQPLSFQPLTHFPSQRPLLNPFAINPLRTLFISTGVHESVWQSLCPTLSYRSRIDFIVLGARLKAESPQECGLPHRLVHTPSGAALTTAILSNAYPMFPISFIFNLVRTLLHFFALPKNSTLLFSSDSALFAKKRGVAGVGIQPGQSGQLSPLHDTPVTSHQARTGVSQNQPKIEGLSLRVSAFDLESLAESAELELAMVFVMGRLVRPYHGFR